MKHQFGRSMIEILGVLAVVGLLSIGGLTMYKRSMDMHKANNIFDDINRFQFIIEERLDTLPYGSIESKDFSSISNLIMTAFNDPEEGYYRIDVQDVPKGVCQVLMQKGEEKYTMYANNLIYEGDVNICLENNDVHFYFGDTEGMCSMPEDGQNSCDDGCLCVDGNSCKPDIWNSRYPLPRPANTHLPTKCCPNDSNIANCHGRCVNEACTGDNVVFNSNKCVCECSDHENMSFDAGQGKCGCKPERNGANLTIKDGKCTCPTAGFTLVGGKCSRIDCRGGTTGNTFFCYIDNIGCGYNCDSSGNNCAIGVCNADSCFPGETFVKKSKNSNYNFACEHKVRDGYICYRWYHKGYSVRDIAYNCYKDDAYCCDSTDTVNFTCTSGLCGQKSLCTDLKSDANIVGNWCVFPGRLTCAYSNGSWICYKYGYYCAVCSGDDIKNDRCCNNTNCKISTKITGSYDSTTNRCEYTLSGEKISCTTTDITTNDSRTCNVWDTKRCIIYTSKGYYAYATSTNYAQGRCSATEANCPAGTKYDYINGLGSYDCKNQTAGAPVCGYNDNNIACYYNGKLCGQFCNYFGQNCKKVHLPQCAAEGHCPQSGYDMTANPCTCDGKETEATVTITTGGTTTEETHRFCCPAGHTYVNGACSIL